MCFENITFPPYSQPRWMLDSFLPAWAARGYRACMSDAARVHPLPWEAMGELLSPTRDLRPGEADGSGR